MKSYAQEYGVKIVATTQRTVLSPRKHNFTSVLYSAQQDAFYTEPPYTNIDVIDRIGSGDAYVAGVLFGLLKYGDPQKAMQFGNATSSVKTQCRAICLLPISRRSTASSGSTTPRAR